jgi:hypothetical protein
MGRSTARFFDRRGEIAVLPRGADEQVYGRLLTPRLAEVLAWLRDGHTGPALLRYLHQGAGFVPTSRDLPILAERLLRELQRGDLCAYRLDPPPPALRRGREPEATRRDTSRQHDIHFVFQYSNGDAAEGHAYELIDPANRRERGQLGPDASIHKTNVEQGRWIAVLKEVEAVTWSAPHARPGQRVRVVARTCGFSDGTAARVRVFLEHRERDAQAIDQLSGFVQSDRVDLEYQFDARSDARRSSGNPVALVAEVAVEGGAFWAKTNRALQVAIPSLERADWRPRVIYDGDDAELVLSAVGFDDGTSVGATLWRYGPEHDDDKLAELPPAEVAHGTASWHVPCRLVRGLGTGEQAPAFRDGALQRPGEYYAVLSTRSPARDLRSRFLTVEWSG